MPVGPRCRPGYPVAGAGLAPQPKSLLFLAWNPLGNQTCFCFFFLYKSLFWLHIYIYSDILRLRVDGILNGAQFCLTFMAIAQGKGSPIPGQSRASDLRVFLFRRGLAQSKLIKLFNST